MGSRIVKGGDDPSTHRKNLPPGWSAVDILAQAEEVAHVGAWAWQITTGHLWWSDEVYRIFGRKPQEFPATYEAFLTYVHPDDREMVTESVNAAVERDVPYDILHRAVRVDGTVRYVRERGEVARDGDGNPIRMLGIVLDVTDDVLIERERDKALRALAKSEESNRLLIEHSYDIVWTRDQFGSVTFINPAVERICGYSPEESAKMTLDQVHPPESAARVKAYFEQLRQALKEGRKLPTYDREEELFRKDGSIIVGEMHIYPEIDEEGRLLRVVGVVHDVTEHRRLEDELARQAITDSLTGLLNRRHGEDLLVTEIDEFRRYGSPLTLMMLDIDHFKVVNDTYGHEVGDQVLIELGRRLTKHLRSSDTLVRWGGEEFVIALRHCTLVEALPLAERARALIAESPFPVVGPITVSIGVAELLPDDDLNDWVGRADTAMYDAKSAGRNRVRPT